MTDRERFLDAQPEAFHAVARELDARIGAWKAAHGGGDSADLLSNKLQKLSASVERGHEQAVQTAALAKRAAGAIRHWWGAGELERAAREYVAARRVRGCMHRLAQVPDWVLEACEGFPAAEFRVAVADASRAAEA